MDPDFERLIGYRFKNRGLMVKALGEAGLQIAGNERLSLLGDKVLASMLLLRWYREGKITEHGTNLLQAYASNKQLASRARSLELPNFICQRLDLGRNVPDHALVTAVEAIIVTVWLDAEDSAQNVNRVMEKMSLYSSEISEFTYPKLDS
ncbi:hypothetical protein N7466_001455 [Penicillium verhagenii]|uniref:uncharacterized protein n=1 Tax=Penicillium verhagenii TaxID=1562060 RepID=UPI00254532F4|nr:uncharacterized protein N7466_001455 [Penicillium verhagenii]KAJ5938321.1 hypothetical protein N7466_001455 [Penicillium verhagenii]